ncbi:Non-motile and phage-resistance protein [Posidoniimonas polymericola]|uniref:histidine kinase n=1 Tax=Posidoniimonas polymericola TaxID=2528002 RepID=A0A5C5YFL4_9BACT|nr:ATP-binding protein [Posidoniimonas polymericola]TWT74516.1 Non-motile and phage-resistance protein [Posidoniimonas polymericola]
MQLNDPIEVLLVEDDPDDRFLLEKQLRRDRGKICITSAESFAEAVEHLSSRDFSVVLTDLSLPDSVGVETVSRLRQHAGRTPILVLTSLDDEAIEHEIVDAGAQDYLVKGEVGGRAVTRAVMHAVQRQNALNEVTSLVAELESSQMLLTRKNEDLKRLYNTAQEIVDNVSHDLRTPLTVIKDYVAMISEGLIGEINAEQRRMLNKVSVRADDLNNMVDDLLDASKLESGLLGTWRRPVELGSVLDRVAPLLVQRAEVNQVALTIDCDDNTPRVFCDCEQVSRVLTNLTVNAVKYSGKGGEVSLWARHEPRDRQVRIGVTDTGPGIDHDSLKKIFQRFEQLSNAGGIASKGFGLGLNIAHMLCRLNLGELSVESEVGKGSTFSFTIPVAEPDEVLRRWLRGHPGAPELRLKELRVDEAVSEQSADELDNFLNCFVRRGDLLLRVGERAWLVVMAVGSVEAAQWCDRMKQELQRANRNRPLGPLPDFEVTLRCVWETQSTLDQRLTEFQCVREELAAPAENVTLTV